MSEAGLPPGGPQPLVISNQRAGQGEVNPGEALDQFSKISAMHDTKQALFMMLRALEFYLARGLSGLKGDLNRGIKINVVSLLEFLMLFGSVYHLIRTSKAYKSSVSTYEGRVDVVKVRNTVAFSTFAEVLAFFGLDRYCAVAHSYEANVKVGLVPAAVLKHDFDENGKAWGKIVGTGLPPIALSRSVGGGEALKSDVGRAAAAIARTVVVLVIDKKEESPVEEKLYFIFVARGYARTLKPAILFELVPGFKMLGHGGWIPARVLTWKHAAAHVTSATFVSTTLQSSGMPIRSYTNKPIPVFNYKPVLVVASSGILK